MGDVSNDLKQTAQLRKAIQPLIGLLKAEANREIDERLVRIESIIEDIAKRETVINVNTPEELTKSISKLAEPKPVEKTEVPTAYEPHDQAKSGVYQYSGFVRSDGKYYIQRVAKGEQRYALGDSGYSDAWDNKGSLEYTRIDGSK